MSSVICTLFENHYHFGVAALTNSLHKQGFKGDIFAGYKGQLPLWATDARDTTKFSWDGSRTLAVAGDIEIHFIPLSTDYHLTNYKPDFMLKLLAGPASYASSIFYFDPDIVVTAPWAFILNWAECGIAVCEDVNSPFPQYHPHRVTWRRVFTEAGITLKFKEAFYANGGYIGLNKNDYGFLTLWQKVQEAMAPHIGGLSRSIFQSDAVLKDNEKGPFAPFGRTDQDALNAALEAWDGNMSMIGKEAMAFKPGGASMPHALGSPKPWKKNYIVRALRGKSPNVTDNVFWASMAKQMVIQPYTASYVKRKQMAINTAKLIGRFYKK